MYANYCLINKFLNIPHRRNKKNMYIYRIYAYMATTSRTKILKEVGNHFNFFTSLIIYLADKVKGQSGPR